MARIDIIDVSLRDGNQSLWGATALNTAMMLQMAPLIERVGFSAIDFVASTHMGVAVRWHRENPWDRIRLMRAAMPNTPLQFLSTGMRFISWETANEELMALAFRLLVEAGIRRIALLDPMNDMQALLGAARLARQAGAEQVVAAFVFAESPLHDDAHYAAKAAEIAGSPDIDRAYLKDPGGILRPERARTLLPALMEALGAMPLELHSHATIGLSPLSYLVAAELGVSTVQVATGPAANGSSLPEAVRTVANLRAMGHTVDIDDAALAELRACLVRLVEAEGLPPGTPQEFDPAYFRHQIPGGVIGTLRRQITELGHAELLPRVIEEIERVRAELGYPIMVTPFPQIVAAQAVINVTGKERYASQPDEVIRYVLGRFGRPAGEVDPAVLDRIHANPRTAELAAQPGMPPLAELRRRIGRNMPDEEFLLRAVMPGEQVDAMLAATPQLDYNPTARPIMRLIEELSARQPIGDIRISKPGFRLELKRHRAAAQPRGAA